MAKPVETSDSQVHDINEEVVNAEIGFSFLTVISVFHHSESLTLYSFNITHLP